MRADKCIYLTTALITHPRSKHRIQKPGVTYWRSKEGLTAEIHDNMVYAVKILLAYNHFQMIWSWYCRDLSIPLVIVFPYTRESSIPNRCVVGLYWVNGTHIWFFRIEVSNESIQRRTSGACDVIIDIVHSMTTKIVIITIHWWYILQYKISYVI